MEIGEENWSWTSQSRREKRCFGKRLYFYPSFKNEKRKNCWKRKRKRNILKFKKKRISIPGIFPHGKALSLIPAFASPGISGSKWENPGPEKPAGSNVCFLLPGPARPEPYKFRTDKYQTRKSELWKILNNPSYVQTTFLGLMDFRLILRHGKTCKTLISVGNITSLFGKQKELFAVPLGITIQH